MRAVPPISIARRIDTEPLPIVTFCVLWSLPFGQIDSAGRNFLV